ncbi:MAG TPA: BTAD domain-containing putative transcriptional regulator, partial [Natronosporangium sp.]
MRFRILGPIRVDLGGRELALTAGRERMLLAILLLHANQLVTGARLIDAIWPNDLPRHARNQLQGCVSRLRKRLAGAGFTGQLIVTEPTGYRAVIEPDDLDLLVFRRQVEQARAAVGEQRYREASARYREALGLWRGPMPDELGHLAAAVEEERTQALEDCVAAELAAGAGRELVAELTDLVRQHPLRESLHRALMLALYRAGRQADALAAFRRARELLHDQLGIEPGVELRQLHRAILNRDPALAGPPAAPVPPVPVPRQLPADVPGFTGRAEALKALDELLGRRSEITGPVVISAIAGAAGIGKTALAVHWGHRVADRFPDGQLYVNLRGFDPGGSPVDPATAVRAFLDALGVPPERLPASLDAQVSLYRSLLAERRMLVVLDNARDADQVRPLLPGAPGCLVLVTSRRRLSGLVATDGAVPLPLDVLPEDEARQLLAARLGPERLAAEPAAVAELIAGCAGLPLALAIVAARAATRLGFPLAAVAEEVRAAGAGLEPFTGPDQLADLRAVFSWSYDALEPAAARLFRLLGLHPGPDLAVPAAASLLGVPLPQARRLLAALTEANLVVEHVPGRFTLHDLLRAYATELTETVDSESDRQAAWRRLLDHYLHTAYTASTRLDPHRPPLPTAPVAGPGAVLVDLPTRDDAEAWLATEEPALVAAIGMAANTGFDPYTWQLANCLNVFFDRR